MPQTPSAVATTIIAPDRDGEALMELDPRRTLFIKKLTNKPGSTKIYRGEKLDDNDEPPVDLSTIEKVFALFNPNCDVELSKENGSTMKENFRFGKLTDFDVKSLTNQSAFLKNLDMEQENYLRIIKQLGQNKSLRKVIENPETKAAFINSLRSLVGQLEAAENKG